MTTPDQLTNHWRACYGIDPRADDLRRSFPDRWLRIHGLPNAKRYPETLEECGVVLQRHNELLSALLLSGGRAVLLTTGYSFVGAPAPVQDEHLQNPAAWYWMTIPADQDDPQSGSWHLFARELIWQRGILDSTLRNVAENKSTNVIILGIRQGVAYHPYDGGGDVIARDVRQRDALRERFRDWLSHLPSGL